MPAGSRGANNLIGMPQGTGVTGGTRLTSIWYRAGADNRFHLTPHLFDEPVTVFEQPSLLFASHWRTLYWRIGTVSRVVDDW